MSFPTEIEIWIYVAHYHCGYPQDVPVGEDADLGHTVTGQSNACKMDPQICPTPQILPISVIGLSL